jgi:hypothetical protein
VHVHGYEAVDLDGLIRVSETGGYVVLNGVMLSDISNHIPSSTQLSNEFQFPIAAFHHASEAYLTPNLIKNTFGKLPLGDDVSQAERFAIYRRSSWDCIVCNERKVVVHRISKTVLFADYVG